MPRREFGCELKVEAVRLLHERRVSVARAARDRDVHETVLHRPREADGVRAAAAADLPEREFAADGPKRKWIADLTDI